MKESYKKYLIRQIKYMVESNETFPNVPVKSEITPGMEDAYIFRRNLFIWDLTYSMCDDDRSTVRHETFFPDLFNDVFNCWTNDGQDEPDSANWKQELGCFSNLLGVYMEVFEGGIFESFPIDSMTPSLEDENELNEYYALRDINVYKRIVAQHLYTMQCNYDFLYVLDSLPADLEKRIKEGFENQVATIRVATDWKERSVA